MESRHINRVPVLDNGRRVGIISRADLLRAVTQQFPNAQVDPVSDAEIRRRVLQEINRQQWTPTKQHRREGREWSRRVARHYPWRTGARCLVCATSWCMAGA